MGTKKLLKYEKPISVDAGKVASVLGAVCSNGNLASDGCIEGFDPTLEPVCTPTGSAATNNCSSGTSAGSSCDTGASAVQGCWSGSTPVGACVSGDTLG